MNTRPKISRPAFTLVELLVVIGIIAILIAILLPVLNKARQSAQNTKCINNIRQLLLAFNMYCDANDGFVPLKGGDGTVSDPVTNYTPLTGPTVNLDWDNESFWWNALPPMLSYPTYYTMQNAVVTPGSIGSPLPKTGSDSIFICPSMTGVVAASQDTSGSVSVRNGYFYIYGGTSGSNGKANSTRPVCFSYGINSKLDNTLPVQKLSQFNDPSSTALIVERRMAPGEVPLGDPYYSVCYPKNLGQLKGDMGRMSTRHNGGANIGFVDGHVAWFSFDELNAPYETKPTVNYNYPGKIVWDPFGPVTSD